MPPEIPTFRNTKTSTAVTFHFRPIEDMFGWALCTVNNTTGELAVQSDWGNWAHRWNVEHLGHVGSDGRRATLLEFIAERDEGHCDYLARKLASSAEIEQFEQFDADDTVDHLQHMLAETRLREGREDLRCGHPAVASIRHKCDFLRRKPLTQAFAREIWEEVERLRDVDHVELFLERLYAIEGSTWIGENLWEETKHRPSISYLILLKGILPSLVAACKEHIATPEAARAG